MTVTHICASGNECTVRIPDKVKAGSITGNIVEWKNDPSCEDRLEFNCVVLPFKVRPVYEQVVRKALGPGRFVEVLPGVRAWLSDDTDLSEYVARAKRN